ncbi:MAG: hypothetical protein HC803_04725, partial [Saprospiraceae bacterium]|nr:hypothetical protein [Saprospiraceae bacterium]
MKLRFLIICLFLAVIGKAQDKHFTYVSDRKFTTSSDFLGYVFIPATIVYPDKEDIENSPEVDLGIGAFSFGISPSYLYIQGEDIEGVYSINSINPTEYGFIISTMNARNPTIQGHLKITLNNKNQVNALIFKKSTDTKEVVYKLADIPDYLNELEFNYFTNANNPPVTTDVIWNREFRPFIRIGEEQQRLRIEDSTKIEITLDTIKTIKKKKEKFEIQRFITISYQGFDDNGNRKDYHQKYEVKNLKERVSRDEGAMNDRYLIEIEVKGLPEKFIYFYLNENETVSMIELGPNRFMIRG